MTKKELKHFFDSISPTEGQKEKVLAEMMKGERNMKKLRRKIPVALAATLILCLVGLTAMAAALGWHEKLAAYFRPTEDQVAQLEGAVERPLVTAQDNGFTVSVLQTITDNYGMYVLYELYAPPELTLREDVHCQFEALDVDTEPGNDEFTTLGTGGAKILEINENKMTVLLRQDANRPIIKEQKASLYLRNLVSYTVDGDDITENIIGEFEVELVWDMACKNETRLYDLAQTVRIAEGANNVLEKVEISPMSVWFSITGDDVTGAAKPVIRFKDGSEIRVEVRNNFNTTYTFSNYLDKEGGVLTIGYCFDRVINISDIESISVGDVTIPVGERAEKV